MRFTQVLIHFAGYAVEGLGQFVGLRSGARPFISISDAMKFVQENEEINFRIRQSSCKTGSKDRWPVFPELFAYEAA